ncbi:FAD:protein FMN transferase [Opitutales bacterium]|jgi:FAD:protein FMN transferase|nr:FAD:protein FMN transferase [Opitutales bacterium]
MTRSLLILAFALLLGCQDDSERTLKPYSLTGKALGTTWTVKVLSYQPIDESKLRTDLAAKIEGAERILSHWRPDAELYQLNATLSSEPVSISPLLHELLTHAKWTYEQTSGAFDPTIAPLVNLWGFGPVSTNRLSIPQQKEIDETMQVTGMNQLELLNGFMVRKKHPALQIDLSASAKGDIIDQVCEVLDRRELSNYLVEIGGEIRACGKGKSGEGWAIGLEDGSEGKSNGLSTVNLLDYSVATSGTYRQTKPNPDSVKPASHLIDPRTGRPIEHNLVAVNVLAPTARDADALATALMILGPEEGMRKAEEMDLIARFCTRERNGTRHDHTTTWMHFFPATD